MQIKNRQWAAWAAGAVAGALLWKSHRVWGFILGGMTGAAGYHFVNGGSTTYETAKPVTQPTELE